MPSGRQPASLPAFPGLPQDPGKCWLRFEARLPEGDGFRDIGIAGGRIRRFTPRIAETATSEIAAGGRLVIPSLVESPFHVDKAMARPERSVTG